MDSAEGRASAPRSWPERAASLVQTRAFVALLLALAILPYMPALGGGFVFDDQRAVVENQAVTSELDLVNIFDSGFWGGKEEANSGSYRPLSVLTFAIDHRIAGGAPWIFHASNIAFHALCVLIIFAVLRRRFRAGIAGAVSILFAVHALHTENIAGIVARADVLATLFGLLAWHLYGRRRPLAIAGSALLLLVSLLFKEIGVAFLGLVIAEEILRIEPSHLPRESRAALPRRLVTIACWLIALGIYLLLRLEAIDKLAAQILPQSNPLVIDADLGARLWTAAALLKRAIELQLAPLALSPDYSYAEIMPYTSPWSADVIMGLALWVLLPVAAIAARRRAPAVASGIALMFAAYAPVSNLLFPVPTIFAERLLYLPSLGLLLALVAAASVLWRRPERRALLLVTLSAVTLLFAARSAARAADWRSPRTLFAAAVKTAPLSARNWFNLGVAILGEERPEEAMEPLQRALELYPDQPLARSYLGVALDKLGRPKEAHVEMYRSVRMRADCRLCALNLINLYVKYGFFDDARTELARFERAGASEVDLAHLHFVIEETERRAREAGIEPRR